MQPSAQLQSVIDVVNEWKTIRHKPFDHILNQYFKERRFIGSKDRQQISWRCYEIFRHKLLLEWWAEWGSKHPCLEEDKAYAIKLMAVYLTLIARKSPGEVNGLFSGEKYGLRVLDRVERKMIETIWNHPNYGKQPLLHDMMPQHIRTNTPKWLYDMIVHAHPDALELLHALNQPATVDLRVNTLKSDRSNVLAALQTLGVEAKETPYSPWGIRIQKRFNLNTLDVYKTGIVEIQDEGSQLLTQITDPKPSSIVVDYCAGAGGKSLGLAMVMQNKGKLILCDTAAWRLEKANDRLRRAGVFNVQQKIVLNTPRGDEAIEKLNASVDTILVDAPCSGTGTWRRNPDARFRFSNAELKELIAIQSDILIKAARLVKVGGRLVYATCSVLAAENQEQIKRFLSTHPDFVIEPIGFENTQTDMLQLLPHRHQTDGFFIVRLKKHA